MSSKHTILAAAIALPLSLAACGSSDSGGTITPQGTHYGYVVSKVTLPAMAGDDTKFGLDLGSKTTSKPDGIVDNAIGATFVTLASLKFPLQDTITTAVTHGNILLLLDFQTTDFNTAGASGLEIKLGANPMPAPCTDANDMTCGHHLDGTGKFDIAPDSPGDALVAGKIAGGKFTGGPGDLALQIAIGSTTAIRLDLVHARATATSISATGITAVLAGLVTMTELTQQVGPPLLASVQTVYDRDCPPPRSPPNCNCKAGSTGMMVQGLVDFNPRDCTLTVDELFTNQFVGAMLMPEGCSKDTCPTPDSVGIGLQVEAVKATFPM